ncbi:hypothetical protein MTO96_001351 [Rhipicephalus appendiculatus]
MGEDARDTTAVDTRRRPQSRRSRHVSADQRPRLRRQQQQLASTGTEPDRRLQISREKPQPAFDCRRDPETRRPPCACSAGRAAVTKAVLLLSPEARARFPKVRVAFLAAANRP